MISDTADPNFDTGCERALELAWEAFCGRTTPVGAVVLDAGGAIVTAGRGRRYERTGPPGHLAGAHVAHAELNALAQLGPDRHYEDHVLLTTLEPCGMCHGAAAQATVGTLAYAGSDPYAGTGDLVFPTAQARRRPLRVTGPLDDERGRLAELLHIVWLVRKPAGPQARWPARPGRPASRPPGPDSPGRPPADTPPVRRGRVDPGHPARPAHRPPPSPLKAKFGRTAFGA